MCIIMKQIELKNQYTSKSELVESFAEFQTSEDVSAPKQALEPVGASDGLEVVASSKT